MRTRHASPLSLAGLTTWTLVMRVFHSLIGATTREHATRRDPFDPIAASAKCQCEHRCDNSPRVSASGLGDPFDFDGDGSVGVVCVHGFTGSPYDMRFLGGELARAGFHVHGLMLPGHGTRIEDLDATRWTDWA